VKLKVRSEKLDDDDDDDDDDNNNNNNNNKFIIKHFKIKLLLSDGLYATAVFWCGTAGTCNHSSYGDLNP
jgi:hypothetical protein